MAESKPHKKGITYDSIMADKSMNASEKKSIIRILGLSKHTISGKSKAEGGKQRTAAGVRQYEKRKKNTRSTGKYAAMKKRRAEG